MLVRELNDSDAIHGAGGPISEGLLCSVRKTGLHPVAVERFKHSKTERRDVLDQSHHSRVEDRLLGRRLNQAKQQAGHCKGLSR